MVLNMSEIELLVWLIIGHIVADFYLQPSKWVQDKNDRHWRSGALIAHSLVHGVIGGLIILLYGSASLYFTVLIFIVITFTHYVFDLIKSYSAQSLKSFLVDQALHLMVLLLVWLLVIDDNMVVSAAFTYVDWKTMSILVGAYLLALKPISVIIKLVLEPLVRQLKESHDEDNQALVNGGRLIGYYERVLILTLTLMSQFAAIGFILAAKSIFRFGDLKDTHSRKLTEYVLLGTLISVTFVLIIGAIAGMLVGA